MSAIPASHGQPRKTATKANVAPVTDMVKQDTRLMVKEIADSVGVHRGQFIRF